MSSKIIETFIHIAYSYTEHKLKSAQLQQVVMQMTM